MINTIDKLEKALPRFSPEMKGLLSETIELLKYSYNANIKLVALVKEVMKLESFNELVNSSGSDTVLDDLKKAIQLFEDGEDFDFSNVIPLAHRLNNPLLWNPEEALRYLLQEILDNKHNPKKMGIFYIEDSKKKPGTNLHSWILANTSEEEFAGIAHKIFQKWKSAGVI